MAETSGFFDAEQLLDETWDREYLAESWANYFKLFVGNGVFATPVDQLKVVAYTGMNVKLLPGWAFINGYWYHNDSELILNIPANIMTTEVIDGIFIQFDSANRITSAVVGNNRSTVDRVSPHYELKVAEIKVPVGATEITDSMITDTRSNEAVCGFVTGLINVINTNDLFQQYTDIFTTWFEEIKGQLDEDAAGHLQNEIDAINAAGLSGSIFDITTVNTELHGKVVTASHGGFSKSAVFDENGVAQITGFTHIGSVHIESTDGEQIAGADVTTPYFARYPVAIAFWAAPISIHTDSSELYGATITIKKGSTVVGTTSFDGSGDASYTATSVGSYTFEVTYGGQTYSANVVVTQETSYSVTLSMGLDLSAWITAGSTTDYPLNPYSYANFAALEADEEVIRQLMLVHNAVDYLATAGADDALIEDVINSDICAKWINLSDYALDTLSANANIKSVMDEADKYGYGEWGLVGQVPTLSADSSNVIKSGQFDTGSNAAWKAFAGTGDAGWYASPGETHSFIGYIFANAIKITDVYLRRAWYTAKPDTKMIIQGSNDTTTGSDGTWTDLTDEVNVLFGSSAENYVEQNVKITKNIGLYRAYRVYHTGVLCPSSTSGSRMQTLQFLAYEPLGNVPIMTANNAPYGTCIFSHEFPNNTRPAYFAFDDIDTGIGWIPFQNSTLSTYIGEYVGYQFVNPICPKKFKVISTRATGIAIEGSNDNSNWTTLVTATLEGGESVVTYEGDISTSDYFAYLRIKYTSAPTNSNPMIITLQFYGREEKLVNGVPTPDYSEKEFASGSTRKTIYDHGVELEELDYVNTGNGYGIKESDQLYGKLVSGAASAYYFPTKNTIDFGNGNYSRLNAYNGNKLGLAESTSCNGVIAVNSTKSGFNTTAPTARKFMATANIVSEFPVSLDVSSITGNMYVIFFDYSGGSNRYGTCKELWLE